ncbi:MAG: DUF3341 domain-containing protein [Bacteroidetes bacterium]|nr:DUF3341 domain-containing protein [Bacteroidota bacterium]
MIKKILQGIKATMGIYEARTDGVYGLLAEFPHPGALIDAARKIRESGYQHFDTHSPFPIHGMDRAMGLGQSKVGYLTLIGGISGLGLATWLQWWTSAIDYPINISGKPFFALEPAIPIMFELTVLLAALLTVGGMLAMNGLPRPYNPLFYSREFLRVTDDAFFLHIAASDSNFDLQETEALLKNFGASSVEVIHDHGHSDLNSA